jgi:large subunit ribosomal protein L25
MILHVDLQRVKSDEKIRVHVPLHFINADVAPGVKMVGGAVSHLRIDVEVSCLPQDLPEFIEADLAQLHVGESLFLSDLKLPTGVEIVELAHGLEADAPIASIHGQKAGEEEAAEGGATPEAAG